MQGILDKRILLIGIGVSLIAFILYFLVNINNIFIPKPMIMAGFDKFGIKEIYPTKSGGEQWFMNMNDPNNDPRTFNTPKMTQNADGSWKVAFSNNDGDLQQQIIPIQSRGTCCQDEVRYGILTTSGYDDNKIVIDQNELERRGIYAIAKRLEKC